MYLSYAETNNSSRRILEPAAAQYWTVSRQLSPAVCQAVTPFGWDNFLPRSDSIVSAARHMSPSGSASARLAMYWKRRLSRLK